MFKPSAKFRKMLAKYSSCAYIYSDGVAILERKSVGRGDYATSVEVIHAIRTKITFYNNNSNGHDVKCDRLVIHDARMLVSGLERVEVWYGNQSTKMKERQIDCTTVIFHAPNGMRWKIDSFEFFSTDVSVQPDPTKSYTSYTAPKSIECYGDNYDKNVVWYDEKGKRI